MAASHEQVAPDVARIRWLAAMYPEAREVLETNKRLIFWCPTNLIAKTLALEINNDGYPVAIRKGKRSDAFYVQAIM